MGQSSSQFPRRALLKNVLAIRQLHSSPMLVAAAAAAKSLQSCPTLCDPRDGSPLGSPIPGILQARTLEWVVISFSNACKWKWSLSVMSEPQQPHGLQPSRLLRPYSLCSCKRVRHNLVTKQQPQSVSLKFSIYPSSSFLFGNYKLVFCICESIL